MINIYKNYDIHLISPQMPDKILRKLSSELYEVMQFIKYSKNKVELKRILEGNNRFGNLSTQTAMFIKAMTHIDVNIDPRKENTDMCQAVKDMIDDAIKKAKKETEKANKAAEIFKAQVEKEKLQQEKDNMIKAKALVKAGTAKEIVAKIMGVNIALL